MRWCASGFEKPLLNWEAGSELVPIHTDKDEIYDSLTGKGTITGDGRFSRDFRGGVGELK